MKNRRLKVFVYRNLANRLYSVRDVRTGKVIAHSERVLIGNARFKVSESGRQRVLRERQKNIHAGVEGTLVLDPTVRVRHLTRKVSYNPYKAGHFFDEQGQPVTQADLALLADGKVLVAA